MPLQCDSLKRQRNLRRSTDDDLTSAGLRIETVEDRQNGSMRGSAAQCGQYGLFRVRIQIGGNLIQQQNVRLRGDGARDGQKLPLTL